MDSELIVVWNGSKHHPAGRQLLVEEEVRMDPLTLQAKPPRRDSVPSGRPDRLPVTEWLDRL